MMRLSRKIISECLTERVRHSPDKIAIIYETVSYTWKELDTVSSCVAYQMHCEGITVGTHVGIWSVNNPNWIIIFLSLQKIGALPVLINTCYREKELSDVLLYAKVEYLYYGDAYKDICYPEVIDSIRSDDSLYVKQWIFMGKENTESWLSYKSDEDSKKTADFDSYIKKVSQEVKPVAYACMLFTSGTTSRPKGVLLTHNNIVNSARATIQYMRWSTDDRMCVTVPMFHCFGVTSSLMTTIILGSTMCILPYYKTIDVLDCIQKHRCTVLNGVPSMFLAMIRNQRLKEYNLSSLKSGIIAGSPLSPEDYLLISRQFPNLMLLPSYGQTETSPAVTFTLYDDPIQKRALSVGKPVEGVEVSIQDGPDGKQLPFGEIGEIMVRGYNVMAGYYDMPDETNKTLTENGWLSTGDLGYLDEEGYLHINGRKKDIIIRAGENISPGEIENCMKKIAWIEQVQVIGVPAEVIQEEIVACLILQIGVTLQTEYIRNFLSNEIATYKIPTKYLVFNTFPVNSSGKIKRNELKHYAMERLEGYGH